MQKEVFNELMDSIKDLQETDLPVGYLGQHKRDKSKMGSTSWVANEVPDVAWRYHGLVMFMFKNPGLYTNDQNRTENHIELCAFYGIDRETSREVTDHLDKYETAADMHLALLKLKEKK